MTVVAFTYNFKLLYVISADIDNPEEAWIKPISEDHFTFRIYTVQYICKLSKIMLNIK